MAKKEDKKVIDEQEIEITGGPNDQENSVSQEGVVIENGADNAEKPEIQTNASVNQEHVSENASQETGMTVFNTRSTGSTGPNASNEPLGIGAPQQESVNIDITADAQNDNNDNIVDVSEETSGNKKQSRKEKVTGINSLDLAVVAESLKGVLKSWGKYIKNNPVTGIGLTILLPVALVASAVGFSVRGIAKTGELKANAEAVMNAIKYQSANVQYLDEADDQYKASMEEMQSKLKGNESLVFLEKLTKEIDSKVTFAFVESKLAELEAKDINSISQKDINTVRGFYETLLTSFSKNKGATETLQNMASSAFEGDFWATEKKLANVDQKNKEFKEYIGENGEITSILSEQEVKLNDFSMRINAVQNALTGQQTSVNLPSVEEMQNWFSAENSSLKKLLQGEYRNPIGIENCVFSDGELQIIANSVDSFGVKGRILLCLDISEETLIGKTPDQVKEIVGSMISNAMKGEEENVCIQETYLFKELTDKDYNIIYDGHNYVVDDLVVEIIREQDRDTGKWYSRANVIGKDNNGAYVKDVIVGNNVLEQNDISKILQDSCLSQLEDEAYM